VYFLGYGLEALLAKFRPLANKGRVAGYIPELLKANPDNLGLAICGRNGQQDSCGDVTTKFTLQSVSKPFALALALMDHGAEEVFSRIGMEPTGDSFNSLMKLETFSSLKPINPLVNAGAIATTALIKGSSTFEKLSRLIEFIRALAPESYVGFNEQVYRSESLTGDRNRAIAFFLRDIKAIDGDALECLDLYFRQCSIEVDCQTLARLGLALSVLPPDKSLIPPTYSRIVRTFMFTCGMYDASGEFAVKVGIPAKSGVSGAIMAVVPNKLGVGVYGPALDPKGNSVAGVALLEALCAEQGWAVL